MWNKIPASSARATACAIDSPAIVCCTTSGLKSSRSSESSHSRAIAPLHGHGARLAGIPRHSYSCDSARGSNSRSPLCFSHHFLASSKADSSAHLTPARTESAAAASTRTSGSLSSSRAATYEARRQFLVVAVDAAANRRNAGSGSRKSAILRLFTEVERLDSELLIASMTQKLDARPSNTHGTWPKTSYPRIPSIFLAPSRPRCTGVSSRLQFHFPSRTPRILNKFNFPSFIHEMPSTNASSLPTGSKPAAGSPAASETRQPSAAGGRDRAARGFPVGRWRAARCS